MLVSGRRSHEPIGKIEDAERASVSSLHAIACKETCDRNFRVPIARTPGARVLWLISA
jgi:hypothetical protein